MIANPNIKFSLEMAIPISVSKILTATEDILAPSVNSFH